MRAAVLFCLVALSIVGAAHAQEQEQERKLMDRLLKPDMSLQNSVQQKEFVLRGTAPTKQAPSKVFHVAGRRPEKRFSTGGFRTKDFGTKASRYQDAPATLSTRTQIAKADVPYETPAYRDTRTARDVDKSAAVSEFDGTRPFLIQGKSQKILSQQDRPLTIDEVRELLNKNK